MIIEIVIILLGLLLGLFFFFRGAFIQNKRYIVFSAVLFICWITYLYYFIQDQLSLLDLIGA